MNKERKLIIAGNWKMNKTVAEALDLVRRPQARTRQREGSGHRRLPAVHRAGVDVSKAILDSNIRLGAQNMSEHNVGAYTGEIAAVMLKEFSARYVILGHTERRQYQKESDALIAKKARRFTPRRSSRLFAWAKRWPNARRADGEGAGNPGARQPGGAEQGPDG